MLRFAANRLALAFMLALGLTTVPGYAQDFRYRYVSLDQLTLPTGYNAFNPTGIRNGGRVLSATRHALQRPWRFSMTGASPFFRPFLPVASAVR
jgi:hypothetical protein